MRAKKRTTNKKREGHRIPDSNPAAWLTDRAVVFKPA
jgi:hypothetical protein